MWQGAIDRSRNGSDKRPERVDLEADLDVDGKELMRPFPQHRYSNKSCKCASYLPHVSTSPTPDRSGSGHVMSS